MLDAPTTDDTDARVPPAAAGDGATATCDVLVIGGGPGGATAAALLARQGRRVVMVEKAVHPRFHIGESLLPANIDLFEQLGVLGEIDRIGMPKYGIEFVSPDHEHRSFLEFGEAWDRRLDRAWQVRRSELDEVLFRHAQRCGAEALEGWEVRNVDIRHEGVAIEATDGEQTRRWNARYVIDASGRDTLLSSRLGLKQKMVEHNSAALFAHYKGAQRLEGRQEGNITIFWFADGWFWFIPLADGVTSVGAVVWPRYLKTRNKPLKEFFEDTIALCPQLAERLKGATLVDDQVHATGNYSYTSQSCAGDRYALVGDAFAFVDPVFSSGVYLAMHSAFKAADLAAVELDAPTRAPAERRRYEAMMRKGPREFCWFIFRITHPTIRDLFMYPRNLFRVKEAVMALLAGDIFGKTPIWSRLAIFKVIYYISLLQDVKRSIAVRKRRQVNIQDVGPLNCETVMEKPAS